MFEDAPNPPFFSSEKAYLGKDCQDLLKPSILGCHLALQTVPPVGASNDTILSVGVLTTEGGSV